MAREVVLGELYKLGGRDGAPTRKYLAVDMATEMLNPDFAETSF